MRYLSFVLGVIVCILPAVAWADLGPKPTIEIRFDASVTDGTLMRCSTADCSDAAPIEPLGPQHFECSQKTCEGMAYGFGDYLQLKVTLQDGRTLTSNIFKKEAFNAIYKAEIEGDKITILETR